MFRLQILGSLFIDSMPMCRVSILKPLKLPTLGGNISGFLQKVGNISGFLCNRSNSEEATEIAYLL